MECRGRRKESASVTIITVCGGRFLSRRNSTLLNAGVNPVYSTVTCRIFDYSSNKLLRIPEGNCPSTSSWGWRFTIRFSAITRRESAMSEARSGDFATSATLSSALGRPWPHGSKRRRRSILSGSRSTSLKSEEGMVLLLTRSCSPWVGGDGDGCGFSSWRFPPSAARKQQGRLARLGVTWHETVTAALQECGGQALLFSNELVDAFPAKWLRWNAGVGIWEEIVVAYDPVDGIESGHFMLALLDLDSEISIQPWPCRIVPGRPAHRDSALFSLLDARSVSSLDSGGDADDRLWRRFRGDGLSPASGRDDACLFSP